MSLDQLTAGDQLPPWATGPSRDGAPDDGTPDADWVHQHEQALAAATQGPTGPAAPPPPPQEPDLPLWARIGSVFDTIGTNVRRAIDNPSEGTKRAFAAGEEREGATSGAAIARGGQELMANSFDVPEAAAGLLAQKAVHAVTGVPGREELEAERRMTANPLEDLGTIGAINREATSRAPEDLQKAKAVAEAATWVPSTAAGIVRAAGKAALGGERARIGVDPFGKPESLTTQLDPQGRPLNPFGMGPFDEAAEAPSLATGARPARAPRLDATGQPPLEGEFREAPNAPPQQTIRATDGSAVANIHPAHVSPEAAAELADALELGRVDPATLPRTIALARSLNAAMTPTVQRYSPEALEVRRQDAVAKEVARQDAINPNPAHDGTIVFVSGPPGAGKSNVVGNQLAQELHAQVADLDALAQHFSGYNAGITKNAVHLEADQAMPDLLRQMADGRNLIVPIVGANPAKVAQMIANARARGYGTVYNFHVDIPTEQSVVRTTERYEKGGMYLPHEYAGDPRLRERSRQAFNSVKESSDGYAAYDNSVPKGVAPILTEASPGLPHLLRQLRGGDHERARPAGLGAGAGAAWDAAQQSASRLVPGAFGRRAGGSSLGGVRQLGGAPGISGYAPGSASFAEPDEKMADVSFGNGRGGPGAAKGRRAIPSKLGPRDPHSPAQVDRAFRTAKDDTGQPFNTEVSPQDLPYAATEHGYINVMVSPTGRFWVDTGAATDHRSTLAQAGLMESYDYAQERHGQDTIYDSMKRNGILRGAVTNAGHPVPGGWTGGNRGTLRLEFATPPTDAQARALRAAMEDGNLDLEWEVDHPPYLANGKEDDPTSVSGEGLAGLNRELMKLRSATRPQLGPGAAGGGRPSLPADQPHTLPTDADRATYDEAAKKYATDAGFVTPARYAADTDGTGTATLLNNGRITTLDVEAIAARVPAGKAALEPWRQSDMASLIAGQRSGHIQLWNGDGDSLYVQLGWDHPPITEAQFTTIERLATHALKRKLDFLVTEWHPTMRDSEEIASLSPDDPNAIDLRDVLNRAIGIGAPPRGKVYGMAADDATLEREFARAGSKWTPAQAYERAGVGTSQVGGASGYVTKSGNGYWSGDPHAGFAVRAHAVPYSLHQESNDKIEGYVIRDRGVMRVGMANPESGRYRAHQAHGYVEFTQPTSGQVAYAEDLGRLIEAKGGTFLWEQRGPAKGLNAGDDIVARGRDVESFLQHVSGESARGAFRLGPGAAAVRPPTERGSFAKLRPGMDIDRAADKLIAKGQDGTLTAADAEELLRFIDRRTDIPARVAGLVSTRLEEIVGAQDENDAAVLQANDAFKAALKEIRAEVAGAKADVRTSATALRNVGRDAMESQRTITRQSGRAATAAGRALQDRLAAASAQLEQDTAAAGAERDAASSAEPVVTGARANTTVERGEPINPRRPGVAENQAALAAHKRVTDAVNAKVADSVRRLDALIKDTPTAEAPAHVLAADLRRAAATVSAEIAKLPKKGLIGSREGVDVAGPGNSPTGRSPGLQTDAQASFGGLKQGRNAFRPTGARLGLEKRRDQLLEAARTITATRRELLTLDRQTQLADMSVAEQIQWAGRRGELDPMMAAEYAAMARAGRDGQALAAANRERDPDLEPLTTPDYVRVNELAEQRADAADRLAAALEKARGMLPLEATRNLPELARAIAQELRNLRSALKAIEPPTLTDVPPLSHYAKQRGILRQGPMYHPDTYALIQEAVAGNPDEYARRLQTVTFADAVNDLAPNVGMAPERFRTLLAKRGELIGPTVAAKMATELQAQKIAHLARTEGRASDAYAVEYGKFVGLVMDLTEGVSEVARTLGAQAIYAKASTARAIDAAHFRAAAEAKLKATTAASAAYDRAVARAEEDAAIAAAQAEAAHGDAMLRIAADTLVRRQAALAQAQTMAEAGRRALEVATKAYTDAAANADTRAEAARQAIIAKAIKQGINPEHVKVLGSFSPYEVEGMARYLGSVKPMLGGEMLYASMVSSMLSAPTSVIKHLMGTVVLQVDRRMTELLQATVTGPAISRLTGHAHITSLSKLRPAYAAYLGALPRGVGHMFSTYTLGIDPTQTDIHASLVGRGPRLVAGIHLGDAFTLGTRAHIAQNAPFWAMERSIQQTLVAYDDALVQLQHELGREPSGAELVDRATDMLNDPHYMATIEPQIREAAYGAGMMGRTSTATKLLSQAIGMAKLPASLPVLGGFPFLKAFVPFMGIADRIAVMAIQRMPGFAIAGGIVTGHPELAGMGLAIEAINDLNAIRNGDDAKASYQAARQLWAIAIGIPIIAAVSALEQQGLITGSGPAKAADLEQWRATGKAEYSVKLNGKWYRWDWVEPFAFMLKIALSAEGAWNDPNAQTPDAKLLEFAGRAGKAVSDSTYLRALGMVISAVSNPGTPVANAVESTLVALANPLSGLSRQLAQTIDPYQRAATNLLEALKATVPWLSEELPAKVDVKGQPLENVDDPLFPWKGTQEHPDPVSTAFAEVQSHVPDFANPSRVTATVGKDLKLDGHELVRFQELAGQAVYQQAQKVIDSVRYKGEGWDQRAKELEAAIREGHTLAKQQLARELMGLAPTGQQVSQTSPRERALAIGIGISAAPGNFERLKLVSDWLPIVDKDPALADALDKQLRAASTQFASDGKLTLADFRKAAPYLAALQKIPEFEEGTPAQWAQYHAELTEYNRLVLLDPSRDRANAYRDTHPVLDNFMWLASHGGKNPGLADLIEQEPVLRRIPLPRDRT